MDTGEAGSGRLTNERRATASLHVGGDITPTEDCGEGVLDDVVHLLNARSADIDATERAGIAVDNSGKDIKEFVGGQGTVDGLNVGEGLGDAELVTIRGTIKPVERSVVR